MTRILLICVLIAFAVAQPPLRPTLDDSFSADAAVVDHYKGRPRSFHGTWYVNADAHNEAFDATLKHFGKINFYHFYNVSKAYEYRPKHETCRSFTDTRPWYTVFDWVAQSKLNGSCKKYGTSILGHKWERLVKDKSGGLALQLELCASDDSQTPYWISIKDFVRKFHRDVTFNSYTPGVPAGSNFQLPSECNSAVEIPEPEEILDERVTLEHNFEKSFDLTCSLCQAVISGVRSAVEGQDTQAAVTAALQKVCGHLPFAQDICASMLAPMALQIANDFVNKYSDRQICDDVRACHDN
jgi:hypothetical protein